MRRLDLLVPAGVADPRHPSGGNRYDREIAAALGGDGWSVRTVEVPWTPTGPQGPDPHRRLRDGARTMVDGLLLEHPDRIADLLPRAAVPLLHMPPSDRPEVLAPIAAAPIVVTTSESTKARVLELLPGHPEGRVVVAPPGVSRTQVVETSPAGRRLRCVAALVPNKGQDVLLAALARIRELDWVCELVGATDLAPDFVRSLRAQASDLGIADRVVFVGPLLPDPVSRLYDGCDLLVLPSRTEAFGMVIAEAIACGVPVVASDTAGTREALGGPFRDARPGLLVLPEDPEDLGRALRLWMSDRRVRSDLTAAARSVRLRGRTWLAAARVVAAGLDWSATAFRGAHHVAG